MEDRKQGQVYYDPTMNPPELPDPNPINDRLAEKAARNPNEPKTEPLDNYLTRVSEQQAANEGVLKKDLFKLHGADYIVSDADKNIQKRREMIQ